MKKIFYGKSDFSEIITRNGYYIDKTMFIEIIESGGSDHLFFFRPRRFGKSLFLSTLEYYYDINRKDDFERLFGDLYIGKNPTPLRNSFPILKLNFSRIRGDNDLAHVERAFDLRIMSSIETFYVAYPERTGGIDVFNEDIKDLKKAELMFDRFLDKLEQANISFYLLIDEYDNFANNLLVQHGKEKYYEVTHGTGFLRGFFNTIKAGTDSSTIARIFATGVTPLVLSDVTSGFNIGANISNEYDFHELAGFTERDVQKIVDYHVEHGLISEAIKEPLLDTMKNYYDGYFFSPDTSESLYNSTSVWHLIRQFHTRNKAQKNKLPEKIIDSNLMTDYKKLEFLVIEDKKLNGNFTLLSDLLRTGQYKGKLVDIFAVNELIDTDKFVSFLYYLGLLTMRLEESGVHVFSVPNRTCSEILWGYVKRAIESVFSIDTLYLVQNFSGMRNKGEWRPFFEYLLGQLYANTSLRDYIQKEAVLKGFLLPYLIFLRDIHIYSEYELNKGFADIYIAPDLFRAPKMCPKHYLLELKYIKKGDITESNQKELVEAAKAQATKQLNQYAQDPKLANVPLVKLVLVVSSDGLLLLEEIP